MSDDCDFNIAGETLVFTGDNNVRQLLSEIDVWESDLLLCYIMLHSLKGCPKIVNGTFNCSFNSLTTLEFGPESVSNRDYICRFNKLESLKGAPSKVLNFDCSNNDLFNLDGCPQEINGNFDCSVNKLATLNGCPNRIGSIFDCSHNQLISLINGPQEITTSYVCKSNKLTNLIGAPEIIPGYFNCSFNQITSLEGCPKLIGGIGEFGFNSITNLHDIHKHIIACEQIFFDENPIQSHVLGFLKIKNLKKISINNIAVEEIINKYLPLGDIIDCQDELIEAGYVEYAQL